MRVTVLTQYYPPEIGAPQRRLPQAGGSTGRARASGDVLHGDAQLSDRKNIPRLRWIWSREENIGGARVLRTFIYPTQSAQFGKRLVNYFSFVPLFADCRAVCAP